MAALLTQPLLDSSGKVVALANSPVGNLTQRFSQFRIVY